MANQWFKFYGAEYLSDPKMDRLSVQERSCWLTLLCMASQTNGVVKYLSTEGLLNKSGVHFNPYDSSEWDNAQRVLQTFEMYEMIEIHKNGNIEIKNWEKRQEHNLTVAERVAKHRENKKRNENVTIDVTSVTTEENRIEENRIEYKNTDVVVNDKSIFGEHKNVKLSEDEYIKLTEQIGENNTKILIEDLSRYIASTKKRYASHYATIQTWARRRAETFIKENKPKRKIV